jgi:hypothetical protein
MSATGLGVFDRTVHKTSHGPSSPCWQKRVSEGEIQDVKHVLPADIRHLWP